MGTLLLLGVLLSLDTFRVSLGLGGLRFSAGKQLQIAVAFGLCDGFAPLLGLLVGQSVIRFVGPWADYFGPALLAVYGAFVICSEWRRTDHDGPRQPGGWIVFGLPLTLSLDNVVAGASLGMKGFSLPVCVLVMGGCSALAAIAGMRLGVLARNRVPLLDREWIGGVALIAVAAVLAIEKS